MAYILPAGQLATHRWPCPRVRFPRGCGHRVSRRDLLNGSGCEALFVVGGAEVAQGRVAAPMVVERDPAEHVAAGVGFACPATVVDVELAFESREERLGEGVVVRGADPAGGTPDAVAGAGGGEGRAGVLAAMIGVKDHTGHMAA